MNNEPTRDPKLDEEEEESLSAEEAIDTSDESDDDHHSKKSSYRPKKKQRTERLGELTPGEMSLLKKEQRSLFVHSRALIHSAKGITIGNEELRQFLMDGPVAIVQNGPRAHDLTWRVVLLSTDPLLSPIFRRIVAAAREAKVGYPLGIQDSLFLPVMAELAALFLANKSAIEGVEFDLKIDILAALLGASKEILLRQAPKGFESFKGRSIVQCLSGKETSNPDTPKKTITGRESAGSTGSAIVLPKADDKSERKKTLVYPVKVCVACSGKGHHSSECLPKGEQIAGRSCPRCGGSGHWWRQCPSPVK